MYQSDKKYNMVQRYILRHLEAASLSLDRILRAPLASLMTICVIGIVLALPTGLHVLLKNIRYLSAGFNKGAQMSLYLKKTVPVARIQELVHSIQEQDHVAQVTYISPAQGLQELQQLSGLAGVLTDIKDNPLPAVLVVAPKMKLQTPALIAELQTTLQRIPEVEFLQLDMEWVKRLYYFVELGERMALALFAVFSFGVVLMVWHTIRLSMQAARQEVTVLQFIGANRAFVRRPFLYTGLWYGLLGGLPAWYLVNAMLWWLQEPVQHLAKSYGSGFYLRNLDTRAGMILLLVAMVLGWLGSWLAVVQYLQRITKRRG